jgi:hypothetical protein
MRNFWDEDPFGDDFMLWLCGIGFAGLCLYQVLS